MEEKTSGRIAAEAVNSISLDDIRIGGPNRVAERLLGLASGGVCIVNMASMRDMAVFMSGLLAAESQGRRFLYRTAASFVPLRAGITPRRLLTRDDLDLPEQGGGLIVVGSYVPKTSGQVAALLTLPEIAGAEVDVESLLDPRRRQSEIARVAEQSRLALQNGQDVVIFTSRQLVTGTGAEENLSIGRQISSGIIAIVRGLSIRPRYLLAKGGITSNDVATEGLDVRRAMVLGQILPGVPVWKLGPESRQPGLAYIVFPGNVGGPEALLDIVMALRSRPEA